MIRPRRRDVCTAAGQWSASAARHPLEADAIRDGPRGGIHLHHAQGPQSSRRQGHPRRCHPWSFLPGAKIGVVGPNGAGKSSVLRIMAGLDQPNNGDAFLAPAPGRHPMQEPPLNDEKTVRQNVEAGLARSRSSSTGSTRGRRADGHRLHPTSSWRRWASCGGTRPRRRLGPRLQLEMAMDALCRRPTSRSPILSGGERRRVAPVQTVAEQARPAAAGRADQPPDAESSGSNSISPSTNRPTWPVTHDRYFLDNVAEWILSSTRGRAYPYEGNHSTHLEKKAERPRSGQERTRSCRRLKEELSWVRSGALPPGRPRTRPACSATRRW